MNGNNHFIKVTIRYGMMIRADGAVKNWRVDSLVYNMESNRKFNPKNVHPDSGSTFDKCQCYRRQSKSSTLHATSAWQSTADWRRRIRSPRPADQHTFNFDNCRWLPDRCLPTPQKQSFRRSSCAGWTIVIRCSSASLMIYCGDYNPSRMPQHAWY